MPIHFHPINDWLTPQDVDELRVQLVGVVADTVLDAAPTQQRQVHLDPQLISCEGQVGYFSLTARVAAQNQPEVALKFQVEAAFTPDAETELARHPKTLGLIAWLAQPAVDRALQQVLPLVLHPMVTQPNRPTQRRGLARLLRGRRSGIPREMRSDSPTIAPGSCHQFDLDGRRLALEARTLTAFSLDEAAAEALEAFVTLPRGAARRKLGKAASSSVAELEELIGRGYFMPPADSESPPSRAITHASVELSVTHRCTLRCRYCYSGHDAASREVPLDMPEEVIDAAVDWAVNDFAKECQSVHLTTGATGEGTLRLDAYARIRQRMETLQAATGK